MNYGFALYETLRRVLLLGVGIAALGFFFTPEEESTQMAEATPLPTTETVDSDHVPQRALI